MFLTFEAFALRCCCWCCRWVRGRRDDRSCGQAVCRSCTRCRWCRMKVGVLLWSIWSRWLFRACFTTLDDTALLLHCQYWSFLGERDRVSWCRRIAYLWAISSDLLSRPWLFPSSALTAVHIRAVPVSSRSHHCYSWSGGYRWWVLLFVPLSPRLVFSRCTDFCQTGSRWDFILPFLLTKALHDCQRSLGICATALQFSVRRWPSCSHWSFHLQHIVHGLFIEFRSQCCRASFDTV